MNKKSLIYIVGLIFALLTSTAFADWQCQVRNGSGYTWYGHANTRTAAVASAMHFCVHNTRNSQECMIDACQIYHGGRQPGSKWQCEVENHGGQVFVGTGSTRAKAAARASGSCTTQTLHARSCIMKECYIK